MNNLLRLAVVGLLVILSIYCFSQFGSKPKTDGSSQEGERPEQQAVASEPPAQRVEKPPSGHRLKDKEWYVQKLVENGWEKDVAEGLIADNLACLRIWEEDHEARWHRHVKLLAELGNRAELGPCLRGHPETASLLMEADDADVKIIAAALEASASDYQLIAGLFIRHWEKHDAAALAAALQKNGDLICRLSRRGLLGCETLFIFDRSDPSVEKYENWLHDELNNLLNRSPEELASFQHFVFVDGPYIRKRLSEDSQFRKTFRSELWPRFKQVAVGGMYEKYLDDPRIWDLLTLDSGQELLEKLGLIPVDLLFGNKDLGNVPYPAELHAQVIQILLSRNQRAIQGLFKYRQESQFHQLLRRRLGQDVFESVVEKLIEEGPNYPERLKFYARLDDVALRDEVGPPAGGLVTWVPFYYTVYEVPKKLLQGRDPTTMDWFSAIADPAFVIIDIATWGATTIPRKGAVKGGEAVAKEGTEQVLKIALGRLKERGFTLASGQLGKDVANKMGEKALVNWGITQSLADLTKAAGVQMGAATTFDITTPVQFMFQRTGVGTQSWKRFSSLDARLFMRRDARIYLRLGNVPQAVLGRNLVKYFQDTVPLEISVGAAVEGEPGQAALEEANRWRQHAFAWWLLNSGQ